MDGTMMRPFAVAFAEWERRYREQPNSFMPEVERILGHTPQDYGEMCAAYFSSLLTELAAGKPWNTIGT